jgi:hypothetical protein
MTDKNDQLPASFFETPRMVIIEPRDHGQVAVTPHDYRTKKLLPGKKAGDDLVTYEEAGYKIVGWEGGEEYKEPRAARAAEPADEPKAAEKK